MVERLKTAVLSTAGLSAILLGLVLVLGYYFASALSVRNELKDQELPMNISANRYLQVGDWPESDPGNSLIRNFQNFIVEADDEETPADNPPASKVKNLAQQQAGNNLKVLKSDNQDTNNE
ncbi:hypothetical protein [Thalassotalea sp. PS06]|uniref:hypothetical protein n=1 Tax=Thalassotalea sp. PS06 TaxID=2594005 RepID=UPI001163673C|nr:hypothetical protein [Thalassotalea sp. PS06]QDP02073.1 hypothetical protein FNC98_12425 [Thalassotalea sp. PS06]